MASSLRPSRQMMADADAAGNGRWPDYQTALKPVVVPLKVGGLFFTAAESSPAAGSRWFRFRRHAHLSTVYCFLVTGFFWFSAARMLSTFWAGDGSRPLFAIMRVVTLIWYSQNAVTGTVFLRANFRRHLGRLFSSMAEADGIIFGDGPGRRRKEGVLKKTVVAFSSAQALLVLATEAALFPCFLRDPPSTTMCLLPLDPLPRSLAGEAVMILLNVYHCLAWACPVGLVCAVSKALQLQFQAIAKQLQEEAADLKIALSLRRRHLLAMDLVKMADRDFKLLYCSYYVTTVFHLIFLGYEIVKRQLGDPVALVESLWIATNFLTFLTISIYGAKMYEAAHSPLPILFSLDARVTSVEESTQLSLFIHQLNHGHLGFTVLDFMVVRKETILTIFGVILTYFFVLLQMDFSQEATSRISGEATSPLPA